MKKKYDLIILLTQREREIKTKEKDREIDRYWENGMVMIEIGRKRNGERAEGENEKNEDIMHTDMKDVSQN